MLILAIDTSGKQGGITLAEGGAAGFRVLESSAIEGGTFSAQLIPTFAALLLKHGFTAKDVDGFAAASGPGSFTGLRVGLSAIKGLAEVLGKPIATVSLLEALVTSSYERGVVAAALDAGRKEVYFGLYDFSRGQPFLISEQLLSRDELPSEITRAKPVRLVTSDHAIAEFIMSDAASHDHEMQHLPIQEVTRPGSEMIARIGLHKLLEGDTVAVEALDANYIRRSDAEIFAKPQKAAMQKNKQEKQ
jgi:tRNA threonylcarbamoyladenosine biosynthesis protein TsaB